MAQYMHLGRPNVVDIKMTGDRNLDEALANGASFRANTPQGYSWRRGNDGTSMLKLVVSVALRRWVTLVINLRLPVRT